MLGHGEHDSARCDATPPLGHGRSDRACEQRTSTQCAHMLLVERHRRRATGHSVGAARLDRVSAYWSSQLERAAQQGTRHITYTLYASASSGAPLRYEMFGYDTMLASHYDHYFIDYYNYSNANPIDPQIFQITTGNC